MAAAVACMWKLDDENVFTPTSTRILRDQAVVEVSLPSTTRHLVVDGVRGWLYPITSETGDAYLLFVYFDGSAYQVKVVEPEVEHRPDPHGCHLFPGARICLGTHPSGGMPTLAEAYSKSVMWCNGYGVYLRTGKFPF